MHASARHPDTGSARAERDSIRVDKVVLHCRHVAFSHLTRGDGGYGERGRPCRERPAPAHQHASARAAGRGGQLTLLVNRLYG